MKQILALLLLLIGSTAQGQTKVICELKDLDAESHFQQGAPAQKISTEFNQDSLSIIAILNRLGLAANFTISNCTSDCKTQRTTALIDESLQRKLYIENEPQQKSSVVNTKAYKQFEIAHQVGHHILEHISLKEERFQNSREVCDTRSNKYDEEECKHKRTYTHYRKILELQADRFAGYFLGWGGEPISNIEFNLIEASKDNAKFYPNIGERLEALRQGYALAREDLKYRRKLNKDKIIRYAMYEGALHITTPNETSSIKTSKIITDQAKYLSIDDSDIEILEVQIVDNLLNLKLKHTGGKETKVTLIAAGITKSSLPPQRGLKLELVNNNQSSATIVQDYYFDLAQQLRSKSAGVIVFKLRNEKIKIEYGPWE